jgi:NCAIR mutase (PurE)-related protein
MYSLNAILASVKEGRMSIKRAQSLLKLNAIAIVDDFARLDVNRFQRRGVPEIVYGSGKTDEQIVAIVSKLVDLRRDALLFSPVVISRVSRRTKNHLLSALFMGKPELRRRIKVDYDSKANVAIVTSRGYEPGGKENGKVALLSAGTSDMRALREAKIVLSLSGCKTIEFNDVGVAALQRLRGPLESINRFDPDVMIIAAGMEGALPSVVASLSSVPIIGIPVSSGYGYGGRGESALMSMLQACSLGITTVNIDSGVGAGVVAALIARRCGESRDARKDSSPRS